MTRSSARWLLAAAVAATPLVLAGSLLGQVRVGQDGRALDANMRTDSYGYNSLPNTFLPYLGGNTTQVQTQLGNSLGNQLITGNVTGGREFRGGVPYTDPREFRGNVGGSSFDRFIAGSAGTPAAYQGMAVPGQVTSFFGSKLATPPPAGYAQQGFTGTFTPAPPPVSNKPVGMEIRIGGEPLTAQMLNSSELAVPGPVDPQTRLPSILTASPLLGIRSLTGNEALNPLNSPMKFPGQEALLSRMKLEPGALGQLAQPGTDVDKTLDSSNMAGKAIGEAANLARPMVTPFDAPQNADFTGKPLGVNLSDKPLENAVRPDQSTSSRLANPLNQPSSQYSELQKRLERYYIDRLQTDEDRNRETIKQLRAKQDAEKAGGPQKEPAKDDTSTTPNPANPRGQPNRQSMFGPTTSLPDYARISKDISANPDKKKTNRSATPDSKQPPVLPLFVAPEPVKIQSLAEGVKSENLATLLSGAEDLMRQGKFLAAVQKYETAEAVAPNQLMIRLGRANAELGAGSYKSAASHLREALEVDPALTLAQFDIKALFGPQRLETVVKDLKQIATVQNDDPDPAFLLAYLAYNTDNPQQASEYLDLADKRGGGQKNDFYRMLKNHWKLAPSPDAAAPIPAAK